MDRCTIAHVHCLQSPRGHPDEWIFPSRILEGGGRGWDGGGEEEGGECKGDGEVEGKGKGKG